MMKLFFLYTALVLLSTAASLNGNAQGFFNQNGEWIKNQIKQIALWEVYIKRIEKGYDIARDGLNTIAGIKNGDFHLHVAHFNALMDVNPEIKKYSKAAQILLLQSGIKKCCTKSDNDYINSVFTHLMNDCNRNIDQLNMLLSPGNYQMTDDERISNIDKLFIDMKDKYGFAKSFSNDIRVLSVEQLKEKNEVKTSRLLNSIKMP
jgi:hypothetical protein